MSIQEIMFSPTGGTQTVADEIADGLSAQLGWKKELVDLTDPNVRFAELPLRPEDVAVIAVPSYGGRVPAVCAERIEKLNGNGAAAVLVCVYGNRAYEDTLLELSDLAEKSGFHVEAAVAAVAEHSIVREIAAGRPDADDKKELALFANQIGEKLNKGPAMQGQKVALPGNCPYKKASAGGMVPKAGSACTNCGLCAAKCPVQAIAKDDPKTVDAKKCISCMRCVSICPVSARKIDPVMQFAVQAFLKKTCAGRKNNELFL